MRRWLFALCAFVFLLTPIQAQAKGASTQFKMMVYELGTEITTSGNKCVDAALSVAQQTILANTIAASAEAFLVTGAKAVAEVAKEVAKKVPGLGQVITAHGIVNACLGAASKDECCEKISSYIEKQLPGFGKLPSKVREQAVKPLCDAAFGSFDENETFSGKGQCGSELTATWLKRQGKIFVTVTGNCDCQEITTSTGRALLEKFSVQIRGKVVAVPDGEDIAWAVKFVRPPVVEAYCCPDTSRAYLLGKGKEEVPQIPGGTGPPPPLPPPPPTPTGIGSYDCNNIDALRTKISEVSKEIEAKELTIKDTRQLEYFTQDEIAAAEKAGKSPQEIQKLKDELKRYKDRIEKLEKEIRELESLRSQLRQLLGELEKKCKEKARNLIGMVDPKNQVPCSLTGKGVAAGHIFDLEIVNNTPEPLSGTIPIGLVLAPSHPDYQAMILGDDAPYDVPPHSSAIFPLFGYCLNHGKLPPPADVKTPADKATAPPESILNDLVVSKKKNSDGSVTERYGDGTTVTTYPDGTTVVQKPDGTGTTTMPDGTKIESFPGGLTILTTPDGTSLPLISLMLSQPEGEATAPPPVSQPGTVPPWEKKRAEASPGTEVTVTPDPSTGQILVIERDKSTGESTVTAYDPKSGKVVERTQYDPQTGKTIEVQYDPETGKPVKEIMYNPASGTTTTAVYDPKTGKQITGTVFNPQTGTTTEYTFDPQTGKIIKKTVRDPHAGQTVVEEYNPENGFTVKKVIRDRIGRRTEILYDPKSGEMIRKTVYDPILDKTLLTFERDPKTGHIIKKKYDRDGNLVSQTWENPKTGKITQVSYDPATGKRWMEVMVDPKSGRHRITVYDRETGLAISVEEYDPKTGKTVVEDYDREGRGLVKKTETDKTGTTVTTEYDPATGSVVRVAELDPLGNTVVREYDPETGKVIRTTEKDRVQTTVTEGDPRTGQTIVRVYDMEGKLKRVSYHDAKGVTILDYNREGKLIRSTLAYPNGAKTIWEYDPVTGKITKKLTYDPITGQTAEVPLHPPKPVSKAETAKEVSWGPLTDDRGIFASAKQIVETGKRLAQHGTYARDIQDPEIYKAGVIQRALWLFGNNVGEDALAKDMDKQLAKLPKEKQPPKEEKEKVISQIWKDVNLTIKEAGLQQ